MQKKYDQHIEKRFEENLFSFISEYAEKKDTFLLAVSGGMDSMVLLSLFENLQKKIPLKFYVANLDHCIRKESEHEQSWLKNYCRERNIPFFDKRVDIPAIKKSIGARASVEQIAREQRHNFLTAVKKKTDASWILTAHHKDDLLETFFIRLLRGTGLNGIDFLKKVEKPFMRPLIDFWREDIETYCNFKGIHHFEDESNKDTKYTRNRIRTRLIPFLTDEFGSSTKDILIRDLYNLKNSATVLDEYLRECVERCTFSTDSVQFDKNLLENKSDNFIREFLIRIYQKWRNSPVGLTTLKIENILQRMRSPGDFEITIMEEICFRRVDQQLLFMKTNDEQIIYGDYCFEFDDSFQKSLLENTVIYFEPDILNWGKGLIFEILDKPMFDSKEKDVIYLDFEKLNFPLKLRFWKEGDSFKPLGMTGQKRLSRFFTDQGITKFKKREQLILEDVKHDIICCVGLRCSEDYKVCKETKKILKIEYK